MSNTKKIMILGASVLQLPAIIKAKEMGYKVIAVDMNPDAIGFNYCDIKVVESTIDIDKVLKKAKELNIDGVMTLASDMPMRTVAKISDEMNLPGIDMNTAIKATNKVFMRKALKENNVPVPKFFRICNEKDFLEHVKYFDDDFIVKPADNSGSRGVYKLSKTNSLEEMLQIYSYCHRFSRCGDVILEEFMKGDEISVESISVNGECNIIQITDKLTTGAPYFVEMGHSQPTMHSEDNILKIKNITKAAVNAIGIKNGPAHTEIILTKNGPKIVELGARLGGDCITTNLVPLSTGIDMVECCIKLALNEPINICQKFIKGSAIRYLNCPNGIIDTITGIEDAKKVDNVTQITIIHGENSVVNDIKSSSDRIGFVISQADNVINAIESCNKAKEKIKISMK